MNVSSNDSFTIPPSSNAKTSFVRLQNTVYSIKEAVFWLGRKLNPLAFKNKIAEAITAIFKNIFSYSKDLSEKNTQRTSNGSNVREEILSQTTIQPNPEKRTLGPTQNAIKPPIQRRYPPLSICDTMICLDGKMTSVHGSCDVFADDEIIEFCPHTPENIIKGVPVAQVVSSKKHVIQQQATRGCTAAAATMLMVDHGKEPNRRYLVSSNLGNTSTMTRGIQAAGLEAQVHAISPTLTGLRQAILSHGSAIVSLTFEECGGHVVVVDEITESLDRVTLRDPYHGWAITVSGEVFLKQHPGRTIIQIQ